MAPPWPVRAILPLKRVPEPEMVSGPANAAPPPCRCALLPSALTEVSDNVPVALLVTDVS